MLSVRYVEETAHHLDSMIRYIREALYFRVNCYDVVTPQTPFGGFKMSGQGREL